MTLVTFVNEPTKVEVTKTDITGGSEIPGAHLQVLDYAGNVVDEWVSEEKPHLIKYLHANREYELVERKPADGYTTAESIVFTVKDTMEVQKVETRGDWHSSRVEAKTPALLSSREGYLWELTGWTQGSQAS